MVKSVLGVNHQGLRDWLFQRVSAVVMLIYTLWMMIFFIAHNQLTFIDWHMLFSNMWMKVATILFIISLLFHAWVGMWTVITDYIKIFSLRLFIQIFVFFALIACFFWALEILWGV